MTQPGKLVLGAAVLALGIGLIAVHGNAADEKGPGVPDAEYPKLVAQSLKVIKDALAVEEPRFKDAVKAKTAAIMIAVYAQSGPMNAERATMRDAALKVADALEKAKESEKYGDARKAADELANLKPNAAAKTMPVEPLMEKHIFIEELMSQFKVARAGGLDMEKKLQNLSISGLRSKEIAADVMDEPLVLLSYQTAMAAKVAREFDPGNKQQVWKKYCDEMEKSAAELAEAVKAKNGKSGFVAVEKLNSSCKKCHDDFRNQ